MNVPVKVFGNERIIEKMKQDATLRQATNVATLPGIVGSSIVMQDGHSGYGFSIGGVAAFDMEEGVISPGGIGFDINCLPKESRVSMQHGAWSCIETLESEWENSALQFVDGERVALQTTRVDLFMKKTHRGLLYEIRTVSGHNIRVTADHPLMTEKGMKRADEIGPNDKLYVYPFRGVKYERPTDDIILQESDVEAVLDSLGKENEGNTKIQVLNSLRRQNLVPLRYSSPQLPYLLKILGLVFGDGRIRFSTGKSPATFSGKREDLEDIRADLDALGIPVHSVFSRVRNHSIIAGYGTSESRVTENSVAKGSTGFAALLIALGCPHGRKTHVPYRVPSWIFKAPRWQQRLFLASLFGTAPSSPSTLNKHNFFAPQLNMNKHTHLRENATSFLQDIRRLLNGFGVKAAAPIEVPNHTYRGKPGKTVGTRLVIQSRPENLLTFFETIGYAYNRERMRKACLASSYIREKLRMLRQRARVRHVSRALYASNIPVQTAVQTVVSALDSAHASEGFIRHPTWPERGCSRTPRTFPSFEEYCERQSVGENGLLCSPVDDISLVGYEGWVYDLTVHDENHNFIADNIVVSNCGVRLLRTSLTREQVEPKIDELLDRLSEACPVGVGRDGVRVTDEQLGQVMLRGAEWAVKNGYGTEDDLENCEDNGVIPEADPTRVPERAKVRGKRQLGTVGAGNHFIEIQVVDKLFRPDSFGLEPGQVVIMIHCGSRGFGHQICSDYIRLMEDEQPEIAGKLIDKNLIYAPISSRLAQDYWGAMNAAANYAFCNRHILGHDVRRVFTGIFPEADVTTVYDVCHNIAKREVHDGRELMVHRKGATRAFPGQPVLIPGSMGTASYVLIGTEDSLRLSFGSTAHGAGRRMSRVKAKHDFPADAVQAELRRKGIHIKAASRRGISEEAPGAYKDVDEIISVSDSLGIAKRVARLVPLGVVKG